MELLIFCRQLTPRLEYICRFLFKDILRIPYRLSSSYTEASRYNGPVLSYDNQVIPGSLSLYASPLLFETDLKHQAFAVGQWRNLPAFPMANNHNRFDIPFDLLAGAFFMVTRYEEYLPFKGDKHGRFRASSSFAFNHGFLEYPIVDMWALELLKMLKEKYPHIHNRTRNFTFQLTLDLDSAYAFRGKGVIRNAVGFTWDMLRLDFKNFKLRYWALTGKVKDPFDIYDDLFSILPTGEATKWFIHAGDWGKFDKSIPLSRPAMQVLVGKLISRYSVGIHPSYQAFLDDAVFRKELSRLVDVLGQAVTSSRFHYLRQRIPVSYYPLIRAGITQEYSMGFAEKPGFRAGTCTPYPFFDIYENAVKNFKIFPFAVMDSTIKQIARHNPKEAIELLKRLIERIKSVNGSFISIWHVDYLTGSMGKPSMMFLLKTTLEELNGATEP